VSPHFRVEAHKVRWIVRQQATKRATLPVLRSLAEKAERSERIFDKLFFPEFFCISLQIDQI